MTQVTVVSSSSTLSCQSYSSNKLVDMVARLAGLGSDSTLRAGVLDMINIGIQEFDLAHDWAFRQQTAATITVTADTATYTLPSDFKKMYDARLTGSGQRTLFALDARSYDRVRTEQSGTATPSHYHLFEAQDSANITLVPTPSEGNSLVIKYYRNFPVLTDSPTDNLCIPQRYIVPIIYKAAELTMAWKEPERAGKWERSYERALYRAIADDTTHEDELEGFMPRVEYASDKTDFLAPTDLDFYPR